MTVAEYHRCDRCQAAAAALVQTAASRDEWWCPQCHIDVERSAIAARQATEARRRRTWHRV